MSAYLVEVKETNVYSIRVFADTPSEASEIALNQFGAGVVDRELELSDTTFATADIRKLSEPETLVCHRCHGEVEWSNIPGYTYYCPECYEDLYTFEVRKKKNGKDNDQD